MPALISCICPTTEARLGRLDGDNGTAHCGTCDGVLADIEELTACPHFNTAPEELEFNAFTDYGDGRPLTNDASTFESVTICQDCDAWYDERTEEWRSE